MVHVQEIKIWEELDTLRLTWQALMPRTRGASFLQSWEWLSCYARHYGQHCQPRILVVRHERETLGILPLVIAERRNRLGRFRALTYPLDDWGNFYGPIGPNPTVVLQAGLTHIARSPRDFDMINLRWVARRRLDRGRTPRAMRSAGFQAYPRHEADSAFIELDGGWDDYWACRSSRWRNNVRRSQRKLAESGDLDFVHYRPRGKAAGDNDPKWEFYDACEKIARASWQGTSTTGTTLSHEAIRAFLRDMHVVAADAGAIDLHLAYVNGQPAAFIYNYHLQGMVTGIRTGFDASVTRDGAGSVLMCRNIKAAYEAGDHALDMGADFIGCKKNWLTAVVESWSYGHYPLASPLSQLVRLKRIWESRRQRQQARTAAVG